MKKSLLAVAALLGVMAQAQAVVVCDSCNYISAAVATNLGVHAPATFDNSTFSSASAGQNGNFNNLWVFSTNTLGLASLDMIFLPTENISNFDVKVYNVVSSTCNPNSGSAGGACAGVTLGSLITDGTTAPGFAVVSEGIALGAGTYAFDVTGTISDLVAGQPASYVGNLQVSPVSPIPEPSSLAFMSIGLLVLGAYKLKQNASA
jgi:hypothetical protein